MNDTKDIPGFSIDELKRENEQLRLKLEELSEKSRAELEQFAYIATHDLKSPLANILGFVDILKLDLIDSTEEIKKSLDWIEYSVIETRKVIDELTESLKYRSFKEEKKAKINLDALTEGILAGMRSTILSKRIVIFADFSEALYVDYYPVVLRSILQNIISNAAAYYDKEKTFHEIKISSAIENGQLRLDIKDNGIGFDSEQDSEKVTGLFKRATYQGDGSGMGLYIVSQLLENHGGELRFESKIGIGSKFQVYLPINE